ncbi:hypothetical protein [Lentibacillus amyloliquefaciens]|uniref:Lipoprotein n=1 Tax=Lentibacillus amyloliquefaciens TaxID=1472767 RepID=A0A0U4E226_9BACI|nr:hypothetical protein [Lentibacillus amyloliquefaciens]ALX47308.1 hypothetical protein AOX59_01060 [Lentibacillus amyloliquefaciens]
MGKKAFVFIALMFLMACNEEPVIVKSDSPPEDSTQEPEIVEQEIEDGDEKEVDEFIEFALPEEKVMVNLKMVPILNSYLQAVQMREEAIEQMTLLPIQAADRNLYLLEFSCHESTSCSYLLLDRTEENRTYLIADLATLVQKTMSPDEKKMLFHFNREESHPPLSDIVVIDLNSWEQKTLRNQTDDVDVLDYTWPILDAKWVSPDSISVIVPEVPEPSAEQLKQWENNNKPERDIDFIVNETETAK